MKNHSLVEKKKESLKNKKPRDIKEVKVLHSSNTIAKNIYQVELNKIEEIYKNYIAQYSKLEQERHKLFNNFVKTMEHRKIEILRKEIN